MNKPARRRSSYKNIEDQEQQQQQQTNASSSTNNSSNSNNGNVMDGAHRKIELQSPEDLTFLINNVRRAAEEHINAAFPPVDGQDDAAAGEDELRVRIERLVTDYISQTFTLAAPNLSINGFDLDAKTFPAVYLGSPATSSSSGRNLRRRGGDTQPQEEVQYEAFDARRRARVEELAREEEDLMREIAALKRCVPAAAAKTYADGFWEGVRVDEEALAKALDAAAAAAAAALPGGQYQEEDGEDRKNGSKTILDGIGPLERQAGVEASYEGVVETLGRLKREMPATVAKMERARVAGEYVVTER
ncbi:uncharacterized protein J7T55_003664 [Diaporthe amygdali]|uniref:uncharacterized protein n=1 Tax=Phomopsis amygdali TaxID=1214568 RepID=UPI0022FDCA72|nr:uncharacterized protein J7T55_003664 [Diaporthe amygdali]KAJ0117254.1 uncharacterized protein J7T55_003664 [Diaporthe amygdali]